MQEGVSAEGCIKYARDPIFTPGEKAKSTKVQGESRKKAHGERVVDESGVLRNRRFGLE